MKFLTKIKEFLKLDSLEEQLQRYERFEKAIQDYNLQLSDIIKNHGVLKVNFDNQLNKSNGDGKYIQRRYNDHFSSYIKKVKQTKDNLQCLENEKTKLLKSSVRLEDEINKSVLRDCIPENELQESIVILATGFEKGIVSGETLKKAKRNFSQLKKVKKRVTRKGQSFMMTVYERIEKKEKLTKADKFLGGYLKSMVKMKSEHISMRKQHDYYYEGFEDFVLKEGIFYESNQLTKNERKLVDKAIERLGFKPQYKQCFYNAQMLTINDSSGTIKYVEGIAHNLIPTTHGWNEINGKLIDVTWKDKKGSYTIGTVPESSSYKGVVIDTRKVRQQIDRSGMASSLLDNWQEKFPMLKKKFKK